MLLSFPERSELCHPLSCLGRQSQQVHPKPAPTSRRDEPSSPGWAGLDGSMCPSHVPTWVCADVQTSLSPEHWCRDRPQQP